MKPKPVIHFVVPDGFVGELKIVATRDPGYEPFDATGKRIFVFPRSGVLKVQRSKLERVFSGWHTQDARFESGEVILLFVPGDPRIKGRAYMRGSADNNGNRFFNVFRA
jgi:hypothetical protein